MSKYFLSGQKNMQLPESVMIFGCGYVGSALAKTLLQLGVRVGALTRNLAKAAELESMGLHEVLVAELDDRAWHQQLKGSYAAVVNCVSSAGGGLAGYRKSYVEGQRSLLEWAGGRSIQTYLYTSSTSVYPQDGGVEVDELSSTEDAPPTGQLLFESEQLLMEAADQFGAWYVLRLAGIYGPGRHYLIDLIRSGETEIPGSGDYFLNMIHRDDIVSAICTVLAKSHANSSGIYNLADNKPETKAFVVKWLAERLNKLLPQFNPNRTAPRLQQRGRQMSSRRISSQKFQKMFGWSPDYKDFRLGYEALLKAINED